MVAAGASSLMAACDGTTSTETGSLQRESLRVAQRNDLQRSQQNAKRNTTSDTSGATKQKNGTPVLEKTSHRLISRVEGRESSKSPTSSGKATPVRETRTSRLRAASVVSPGDTGSAGGTSWSRRQGTPETSNPWRLKPASSTRLKERSPMSSDSGSTTSVTKERDKSHKRKSFLNRSLNTEEVPLEHGNQYESADRRTRRAAGKRNHISEGLSSSDSANSRQSSSNPRRKCLDTNESPRRVAQPDASRPKARTTPPGTSSSGVKNSSTHHTSGSGHDDSEVSRRVDALTALTRATMERVERLTSSASPPYHSKSRFAQPEAQWSSTSPSSAHALHSSSDHVPPTSPSKCSILKRPSDDNPQENPPPSRHHPPISILKHNKQLENDPGQPSANISQPSSHLSPVTFSPLVVEPLSKRHGILKKRSSLDESEILRRRSCSPDVSFAEVNSSDFRPILKNQRRSSLDEIVRRAQSPEAHPTSILKRKSSRDDEREDRVQLGSPEPQGILKRKSGNVAVASNAGHHVSIVAAAMKAAASGAELVESSEVRPILKKKNSREESLSTDSYSLEPRPILKKKSSTESDEHEDRPMKTILKCSRKSSQEDSTNEGDVSSPKKLSVLRNRPSQADGVRPILKQSGPREGGARLRLNFCDEQTSGLGEEAGVCDEDSFLRKRAQSVGHVHLAEKEEELKVILGKRRSLESASLGDVRQERLASRMLSVKRNLDGRQDADSCQYGEGPRGSSGLTTSKTLGCPTTDHLPDYLSNIQEDQSLKTSRPPKQNPGYEPPPPKKSSALETLAPMADHENPKLQENSLRDTSQEPTSVPSMQPDDLDDSSQRGKPAANSQQERKPQVVQRSSSVSQMASHFKALEEQAKVTAQENAQRRAVQKGSRGVQRYRERKEERNQDRFSTQPVTYQELQEAVLQNQRNTEASSEAGGEKSTTTTTDDEFDPSKLSLAERVRLFNQKIATESIPVAGGLAEDSRERSAKRRLANRYKTQPVTSEEVEVACRISPFGRGHQGATETAGDNTTTQSHDPRGNLDHPRGILKSSTQTSAILRPGTPELEGFKLLKSVLKKESEELQHPSDFPDAQPRSILKNDSSPKTETTVLNKPLQAEQTTSDRNLGNTLRNSPNSNLAKILRSVEASANVAKRQPGRREEKENLSRNLPTLSVEAGQPNASEERKLSGSVTKCRDGLDVIDDAKKKRKDVEKMSMRICAKDETPKTSDDETSSSGGREVRSIIRNEAVHRRRQAALAKQAKQTTSVLSKSSSHHELSSESSSTRVKRWGVAGDVPLGIPLPGLCRSATQPMPVTEPVDIPGASIADRLAALQHSGSTSWKRRVPSEPDPHLPTHRCQDNDSEGSSSSRKNEFAAKQGVLADRLGKLESAAEGWRKRVSTPDAVKFSVAGKMKVEQSEASLGALSSLLVEVAGNGSDKKKKAPRAERFRGRKGNFKGVASTPTSPSKEKTIMFQRSFSEPCTDESADENYPVDTRLAPTITVPRADDEAFTSFFSSVSLEKCENECLDLTDSDFDLITSHSELLVQKRTTQTHRRRMASKNPLRTLAARTDIKTEYTEVRTGVAERVMKSLNMEKLSKNSSLAVEALAGLASTEDFSSVTLRNTASGLVGPVHKLCAYKDLMLILVKGRRHVQVRLVEPVASSINSGDNYVLVTPNEVFNYVGKYSNVIEKARGAELAFSIQQHKDLGCSANQIITVSEEKPTCSRSQVAKFWQHLGVDGADVEVVGAGHPDEDELYESAMIGTNMVYEITAGELVPLEKYWGAIPKIEMLDPSKILVFDFGSEMYIWNGKTASVHKRKFASRLAEELWGEGFDYAECTLCPITVASMIGARGKSDLAENKGTARPEWCLLAKVTQHMESILFREKFLDWPDFSRVIRAKGTDEKEQTDGSILVEPSDANAMIEENKTPVDLVLEGSHLGRGTNWYDEELMRMYLISTLSVTVWHIDEFSYTLLDNSSIGQFHTGDSYIVRWTYTITITGRELNGQPSKHSTMGRDRCAYFIWQGKMASLNEQGTAALLTVELDQEQGPQVRVDEGSEPAAFLNLFSGGMVVHSGKKTEERPDDKYRLYMCRGTLESETSLVEVACSTRQLRSRGSLLLLDAGNDKMYVWHGCHALPHIRQNALNAATKLKENLPEEAGLTADNDIDIHEINEGEEPEEFFNALGGSNKKLYVSLKSAEVKEYTPRLFHLSGVSGEFTPTELLCAHRADLATPFPFLQDELYQVNQPALFLFDNGDELWVWQGWWPDSGMDDQTGSGAVRWQAERRAIMATAIQYWKVTHPDSSSFPVHLVWAGLEPLEFTNLFPIWVDRDDIAELNIKDGRKPGEVLTVESELARLTQSTYPPAQLLQRPLPEGVDPTHLELYLSPQHFEELLGMTEEEYQELPAWKQKNLKKEIGLF